MNKLDKSHLGKQIAECFLIPFQFDVSSMLYTFRLLLSSCLL